jgi:signal transduction histidine kinase
LRALAALGLAALGAGLVWVVQRARMRLMDERHQLVVAERTRMARELHDTFSQGFTALAVHLEAATRRLATTPDRARENLEEAKMVVRDSLTDARRAIWALRPESLDRGDLPDALGEMPSRLGAEHPVEIRVDGQRRALSPELELALVRVGQEALTNAFKHAQAGRIELAIGYAPDRVRMTVIDDGRGFDSRAPAARGHFGLRGIRERVEALGGTLEVRSREGGGTEVSVEVPA